MKDTPPEWVKRGKGGYFNSEKDAQDVLDALHSGKAKIVGYDKHGHPIVRHNDVTGVQQQPAGRLPRPADPRLHHQGHEAAERRTDQSHQGVSMSQHLDLENTVVLAAVQALIGAVTPSMAAISVEVDAEAETAVLHVALQYADNTIASLLEEVADDINQYSDDAVAVSVTTWVGEDWSADWPGRHHRMVFAAFSR